MLQRIKNASVGAMFKNEFEGTIEIDECYVGGSESNKHAKDKKENGEPMVGGSQKPKTVVLGMVNRDTGCVKAMKVPSNEKHFLLHTINGTHHWICLAATVGSKKHTNKYLAEMSFRCNTKELSDSARFVNFLQISFKKLTYKDLIKA